MEVSVKKTWLKIAVPIAFVIMVTVNALASLLPINGMNTAAVSAKYDTLFTPAGYAFSIWGIIYLLLLVYTLFQALPAAKDANPERQKMLEKVGFWFVISSLLNAGWIFLWQYELMVFSVIVIALMLVSLGRIGWLLRQPHCSPKEELALRIPFGIYFGWITVATIANISAYLVSTKWNGFGISPVVWTIAILVIGLIIASVTMYRVRSVAYGLTVLWAYTAILVRHLSPLPSGYASQHPAIIITVAASMAVLLVMTVISAIHMRRVAACGVQK